jgi:glycosyltransferase involved in cell wall biosynthesis
MSPNEELKWRVETLVRACVLAGVKLAVAGDGPLMPGLQAMLHDGAGNVRLFGHCEGDQLAQLVRGARAVVVPSQWYENAPLSVLESFAAGKPVIGSRIGGIPELIDEGRTGWLVEPGDVEALVSAVLMVNALPDASVRVMGRAARARVERDFHWRGYLASTMALYKAIGVRGMSAGSSSFEASGFPDLGRVQPQ